MYTDDVPNIKLTSLDFCCGKHEGFICFYWMLNQKMFSYITCRIDGNLQNALNS